MMPKAEMRSSTKRARTRDQLLVSAQTLLMAHGAAALGLRQVTDHAGLVHASFYNYYRDIPALIADLGELLGATHAAAMMALIAGVDDPAVRFARITRQTLRFVALAPGLGRLMFDIGLPVDSLSHELRVRLKCDIAEAMQRGIFAPGDAELTASMIAGAISGVALDLHRGILPMTVIDTATTKMLTQLGLHTEEAERLGNEPVNFPPPPAMPMRWLALPPIPAPAKAAHA